MLEELRSWLESFVPLEQVDLFLTSFENFRDINDLSAETEFSLLWEEHDRIYSGEMIDSLKTILYVGAVKILRSHGIFFTEETSLVLLNKAIEAILWLNNTDDHDDITRIFSEDISDNAKFAELCQFVNNDSLELWQDSIVNVSSLFCEKVLIDHTETRVINDESSDYDISALTRYDVKFQNRMYRRALELGANPGVIDPVTLVEMYRAELGQWCPFDPREAAIDLAGLVLFSDIEQKNLAKQSGLLAERIFSDISFLQAIKSQLAQVFGEIKIYG